MSEKVKAGMVLLTRIGVANGLFPMWVCAKSITTISPNDAAGVATCSVQIGEEIHEIAESYAEVLNLMDKAIPKPVDPALFLAFMKGVQ